MRVVINADQPIAQGQQTRTGRNRASELGLRKGPSLCLVDRNDPIAEIVAKKIIEIGATGVRDPAEISRLAVEQLGVGEPPSV